MPLSHDNLHALTLIDRTTGQSVRVDNIANDTVGRKRGEIISGVNTTNDYPDGTTFFVLTGTSGGVLNLDNSLKALLSENNFASIIIADEGGNVNITSLIITPDNGLINGVANIDLDTNYGRFELHTDGTDWFAG